MRIIVLHHEVAADAAPDDRDVLVQAEAVASALARQGHEPIPLVCGLDLASLKSELLRLRPDVMFNLVESLDGADRLMHLPVSLFERLGIPFTGSGGAAMLLANDKPLAKRLMRSAGLPTPDWWMSPPCEPSASLRSGDRVILKMTGEHASLGIDDGAVVAVSGEEELSQRLSDRQRALGRPCFAERFVDGREFNLSLLARPGGVEALPCAEIDFSAFGPNKPRIVGYDAKWSDDSFESRATPRRFGFPPGDQPLLDELARLACESWRVFGLGGYARVDFRVDSQGRPWILEVNANPCLSPDAGFAAAVDRAGLTLDEAVARIVEDAVRRMGCADAAHPRH